MLKTTLQQWEAVDAVLRCGSIAKAAEFMRRSQPALSYQIAQLQERLGVPLFELQGRQLQLTDIGNELMEQAHLLLDGWAELEQRAQTLQSGVPAVISLVVDCIFPKSILFKALKTLNQRYPNTQVHMKETVRDEGIDYVNQQSGDLYIVTLDAQSAIDKRRLMDMRFVLVANCEHPLFDDDGTVRTANLGQYPLIQVIDKEQQHTNRYKKSYQESWYFTAIDSATDAIMNQLGYGWLPEWHIQSLLTSGKLRRVDESEAGSRITPLYLIDNKRCHHRRIISLLGQCLEQEIAAIHQI